MTDDTSPMPRPRPDTLLTQDGDGYHCRIVLEGHELARATGATPGEAQDRARALLMPEDRALL